MGFLADLLGSRPYPSHAKGEVDKMINELIRIGQTDDFLSERPGSPFNFHCRHMRAVEIGERLNELGGFALMEFVRNRLRRKLDKTIVSHLEYAWVDIGKWIP